MFASGLLLAWGGGSREFASGRALDIETEGMSGTKTGGIGFYWVLLGYSECYRLLEYAGLRGGGGMLLGSGGLTGQIRGFG